MATDEIKEGNPNVNYGIKKLFIFGLSCRVLEAIKCENLGVSIMGFSLLLLFSTEMIM